MSDDVIKAQRIVRRIEKYVKTKSKFQRYLDRMDGWIKKETVILNQVLKGLTQKQFELFKESSGYVVEPIELESDGELYFGSDITEEDLEYELCDV